MKQQIIVMGDVEIGGGTLTDDFIADKQLSQLIRKLAKRKVPIDLVFNGDTFDFLKCPYIVNGQATYPRHINSAISISKLEMMYKAHTLVFNALAQFAKKKQNKIYFVIGNHDHDLFFRPVQRQIRRCLKSGRNVHFSMKYTHHDIYIEHGHQYDFLNKINPKNPFLHYKGHKILNYPWISFGLMESFMQIKEEHPFLERIVPKPALFKHHSLVVKKINTRALRHFLKSMFYYPIRYFYDPTHFIPRNIVKEFYRRFKRNHWDIDEVVGAFKRWKKRKLKRYKIIILGHDHKIHTEEKNGKAIILPDTWRDEYRLDEKSKMIYPKTKRYVEINIKDDKSVLYDIIEVENTRKALEFEAIRKDEHAWIKKVAKIEGYVFSSNI